MAQKNRKATTGLRQDILEKLHQARTKHTTYLHLENMAITEVPEELFDLKDLEGVYLNDNQLKTVPERLWDLPHLREVSILGNPIEFLPDRPRLIIDGPIYLRCRDQFNVQNIHLVLGTDAVQENEYFWVSELMTARELRHLTLGSWSLRSGDAPPEPSLAIRNILDALANLEALESLNVRGLLLNTVPVGIRQLRRLKKLGIDALNITELPDWIGNLGLTSFSVADNKLSTIPDSLQRLRHLKSLRLSWNPLEKIPGVVFNLPSLENLHIEKCNIREIPTGILHLHQLRTLACEHNPIESPPEEVAQKGLDAIRDYWRQRADVGVDYLCEAKLIILGEAGAGKTSLARKIANPDYELQPREKSTEGIDVIRYDFPTAIRTRHEGEERVVERQFQANIWDFGGQEIYHATHQFFLTRRSVYILVCDDRKEDTDFSYWLQIVEMLSDASPVLIVQNEKQDRKRDINLSGLRAQFANLQGALAMNLDTNRGLDQVIEAIRKELAHLPHIGIGLPSTWKRVREALEQDSRDYISLEEYLAICQQHGFTRREDKLQLSGYLHDLGICLHFQDDPVLKNTVILKPTWGTDAVYRVLDDLEVIAAHGHFTREHLGRIWSEVKYEGMQDELLRLMMRFQLCYALDTDQDYIAPQLLSSEQPAYPWETAGGLVLRYEYAFLPKGILTRFIVAMHHLIADGNLVWKTGVVLEREGCRAEIIEEYFLRRIRVRASGPDPYGLLSIVNEQLERLHASFPRLKYDRYLPCPCEECRDRAEPHSFALLTLANMATKNQSIQCYVSGDMIDAAQLLRAVLPGALRPTDYAAEFAPSATKTPVSTPPPSPEVFVSYAWGAESSAIVDKLQEAFGGKGIHLLRDREEARYRDSIREFMHRIGQGKCIVVVISEKYLKSENCMFELLEIAKAQNLRERIFPIVLSDANIYKATGRIQYVRYWEEEIHTLNEELKTVRGDNLTELQADLTLYSEIRRLFDGIAGTLRDMNALTPDMHVDSGFEEVIRRIRTQLGI